MHQISYVTEKLAQVTKALVVLSSTREASKHNIPPVVNHVEIPNGHLPDGRKAHVMIRITGKNEAVLLRLASEFETRPTRKLMRKIIERSKAEGQAPTIFIYAKESMDSVVRKVANCIKIGINILTRAVNVVRHWINEEYDKDCLMTIPSRQVHNRQLRLGG